MEEIQTVNNKKKAEKAQKAKQDLESKTIKAKRKLSIQISSAKSERNLKSKVPVKETLKVKYVPSRNHSKSVGP